ncbi:TPA: hypothetical protein I7670_22065 [Vibrio vulnificus]|nr:hypothetical protein [Vibrio vulnificus]
MRKFRLKLPIFFLLSLPVMFCVGWVYEAHQSNLSIVSVFNRYLQDTGLMILLGQLSLANFVACFTVVNSAIEFDKQNQYVQRLYFIFAFFVSFIVVSLLSCLVTFGNVCNLT